MDWNVREKSLLQALNWVLAMNGLVTDDRQFLSPWNGSRGAAGHPLGSGYVPLSSCFRESSQWPQGLSSPLPLPLNHFGTKSLERFLNHTC